MRYDLFPKSLTKIDLRLLQFQEQIEQGHTFIPAILAYTIRALCMAKTKLATHLECCVSLLQVWFLGHLVVCKRLVTKGLFQEDLIQAHLRRMSLNLFKRKDAWNQYLKDLKSDQLCWKLSSHHIGEGLICDIEGKPLLLLGFRDIKHIVQSKSLGNSGGLKQFHYRQNVLKPPLR